VGELLEWRGVVPADVDGGRGAGAMSMKHEPHDLALCLPMLAEDELERLAGDIAANGLHHPILLFEGKILDGRNRLAACHRAGVEPRFTEFGGGFETARALVWSQNVLRRHLPKEQQGAIWIKLASIKGTPQAAVRERSKGEAKERQREHGGTTHGRKSLVQEVAQVTARKARTAEAREAGVSHETLRRLRALDEQQIDAVAAGQVTLTDIRREKQREQRAAANAEIAKANATLPVEQRRYPVILADPPWRYEHVKTESRAIENQYPTMDLEAICALPVGGLCTENAILFCWATSPKLAEALEVIDAWGFTYRTCAIWDKERIGMGYYYRQQHELLLVCTRGDMPAPPPAARPPSVIRVPRDEKHSAKPTIVYEQIEAMYPDLPRIELFARNARAGWDAWGNQA